MHVPPGPSPARARADLGVSHSGPLALSCLSYHASRRLPPRSESTHARILTFFSPTLKGSYCDVGAFCARPKCVDLVSESIDSVCKGRDLSYPLFASSAALRLGLVAYSIYHDARSAIKYTDIDYQVFTDAARELYTAQTPATGSYAPRLVGDPFARDTYRYTPLLAVLMLPNITLHPAFGKLLFSLADLGVGWLLLAYLRRRGLSPRVRLGWAGGLWLLNPWVAAISTRGSSEALLGLLVVASLERAEAGRWNASAIWLGLAAHFKLYPVIYGAAILARLWRRPVLAVRYSLLAATTFTLANAAMYAMCVLFCTFSVVAD